MYSSDALRVIYLLRTPYTILGSAPYYAEWNPESWDRSSQGAMPVSVHLASQDMDPLQPLLYARRNVGLGQSTHSL